MHRMAQDTAPESEHSPAWSRFGALPVAAGLLVFLNGLYILLAAFGNITDVGTNQPFVQHVLSMDTTNFGAEPGTELDPDVMWRAVENEALQDIAYVGIVIWERAAAIVLLVATVLWFRDRDTDYRDARALSTIGLLMLLILFFGGFITIGGEWFQMWKSVAWNGLDPAFRNSILALVTLVLVQLPSPHLTATG